MIKEREKKLETEKSKFSDASLSYYHKKTLDILLKLEIIQYRNKQQNNTFITVEQTPVFLKRIQKYNDKKQNRIHIFEKIIYDLSQEKRVRLRKNITCDVIKLMGLEWGETSLEYYHKDTFDYLIQLGIIHNPGAQVKEEYSVVITQFFKDMLKDQTIKDIEKNLLVEKIFINLAQKKGLRLGKELRYDMIKLTNFIEKFGENGRVWKKQE